MHMHSNLAKDYVHICLLSNSACAGIIINCFSIGSVSVFYAAFGQGTGPIYLGNVGCTGMESSLLSCSHSGIGVTYCGHYEDAGVVCQPC